MITRRSFKILLSFVLFGAVLASLPSSESVGDPSCVTASIAATATVIEPLGLLEQPGQSGRSEYLLYSPRRSHTICTVEQLFNQSQLPTSQSTSLVAASGLPASPICLSMTPSAEQASNRYLVTVIYTEN